MASGRLELDEAALERACTQADGLLGAVEAEAAAIASRAEMLGSGYRTQLTTDWATGEQMGGKSPRYVHSARVGKKGPVGLVATANYAAMKGELEQNFLLKAKG